MAIKMIDLDKVDDQLTILLHGDSGAGKTFTAATFPRPLFISPDDEKGWETLKYMPSSVLYEPDVRPIVWSVSEPRDFVDAYTKLVPLVREGKVKTIVVDSLTFYADMFYTAISQNQGDKDGWKVYGQLNDHLRRIRIELHKLDCHIIWLAITRHPDDAGKVAVPNLKGQQAVVFPAGCKYVWYMRAVSMPKGMAQHELRTRKFMNVMARGRDGGRLPDPLVNPSYRSIIDALSRIPTTEFVDTPEEHVVEQLAEETGVNVPLAKPAAVPPITRRPGIVKPGIVRPVRR